MTLVRFSVRGVICVATAALLSACAQQGAFMPSTFARAPADRASRPHSAQMQRSEEREEVCIADCYALHQGRLVLRSRVRGFRRYDQIPRRQSFGEASAHQQHQGLQPSTAARNGNGNFLSAARDFGRHGVRKPGSGRRRAGREEDRSRQAVHRVRSSRDLGIQVQLWALLCHRQEKQVRRHSSAGSARS